MKTLLQLRHETIPPSPHADPPNPNIDFANSPFIVRTQPTPWPANADGAPRIAAVSSFGAGGANGHVIIQEYRDRPARASGDPAPSWCCCRHAARTGSWSRRPTWPGSSARRRGRGHPGRPAWTLMVGREPFEHRLSTGRIRGRGLVDRLERIRCRASGPVGADRSRAAYQDSVPGESVADRDYLQGLYSGGQMRRLGELWTQGWAVDWAQPASPRPAGR